MSEPMKVVSQGGQVGLRIGQGLQRTYWLSPLDALDVADDLHEIAEQVGAEAISHARAARKQAS